MTLSPDSILFDLDGTLWDSTATVFSAWESVLKDFQGLSLAITQEKVRAIAGTQHDQIFQKLFPQLSAQQTSELTHLCGEQELVFIERYGGQLFEDTIETIESLSKSYPLFIVSNCQAGYIEAFLRYYQLDRFINDFECSGRTLQSKSENIRSIISRNNLKRPVYIGDTQGDSLSASENQIPFIYAAYGFGSPDKYDFKIERLDEVKEIVGC